MGGYIGMWLALRDPDAVGGLVNLHSPAIPTFRLRLLRTAGWLPGTRALTAWLARRDPERWAHRRVHYYDESVKSREETRQFASALDDRAGSLAFAAYLFETMAPGPMDELVAQLEDRRREGRSFPAPLSLLYAERDPMVPPEVGRRLAELIPDADYRTVPRASHFLQVDRPDYVVDYVRQCFDSPDGADG